MRLIARRGKPIKTISDNGTNFIGVDREFKEYVASGNRERIEKLLVQQRIVSDGTSIHLLHLFLQEFVSGSALVQLCSLEWRFQRDPNLRELYQQLIDKNVENGLLEIFGKTEVKGTFEKDWCLPHHPVVEPDKPCKICHVCNAAAKYKGVCLNGKLLAGPNLLYGSIGTLFPFWEGPTALNKDI